MWKTPDAIYYAVADRSARKIEGFARRYDHISEWEIVEVFSRYWYRVYSMMKSESWGTAHLVYFVDCEKDKVRKTLVFRANAWVKWGFEDSEISMLAEKIITDTVRRKWVSTNTILEVDISRSVVPFDYQIEEVLQGEDPERYVDENWKFNWSKEDYDRMSYELWQAIAKYSQIQYSGYGIFDEAIIREGKIQWKNKNFYEYITTNLDIHLEALIWYGVLRSEQKTEIFRIFETHVDLINDCESCLVHHDLADHNLMYNSETKWLWGVFDWEAMVLWDPMLDMGSCPTWGTHYPRRQLLIDWYSSVRELPRDYELRMDLYELRTWIWKILFIIRMEIWDDVRDSMLVKMHQAIERLA